MPSKPPTTPLMRQYHSLKQQAPNALLLFRLGDFYELFHEDAIVAAEALEITLTSRNKEKGEPIPMCGVPAHSVDGYITKLLQKGFRVAIGDQVEDPKATKKLVRRELTRLITPGTAGEWGATGAGENNFLAAVAEQRGMAGLAYVDLSTGEFRMTETTPEQADALLLTLGVREVLKPAEAPLFAGEGVAGERGDWLQTELDAWVFTADYAERLLCEHYGLHTLDGLGASSHPQALCAAVAVLHYLRDTQKRSLDHLGRPEFFRQNGWMVLDPVTVRNLELVEPLFGNDNEATLLAVLAEAETAMGSRLLRQWLLRPSVDREQIESRHEAVAELLVDTIRRGELENELGAIGDIERLLSKVALKTSNPRELSQLGASFQRLPVVRALCGQSAAPLLKNICERMDDLADVRDRIREALADEPPVHLQDGSVIRAGVSAELDELREIRANSKGYIASLEHRERESTGIGSLKVKFNNVFGFFIEVSKANMSLVPDHYDRKQTLVNAERFITPELKEYESKVLDAEERILAIERELFEQLRADVAAEAQRIRQTAEAVAWVDVLRSFAKKAAESEYARPQFNDKGEVQICAGRHPVVEHLAETRGGDRFVPNSVYLNGEDHSLALITGPNMGGKSTFLRQVALAVIMAQMGSFVPAKCASLPVTDRVFTRIGASDNLASGRSTFMVEMTETAEILNTATERSLVLLDEVGRGTSTYDGLAIAWAVAEYIHEQKKAKTLFATHYHELTALAEQLEGVFNLRVAVKEAGDRVVFLRKVEKGAADRSYGIEVARLAGLPLPVVERAQAVLRLHERQDQVAVVAPPTPQVTIFEPAADGFAEEIGALNLDEMTPLGALKLLSEWKERVAATRLGSAEGQAGRGARVQ